MSVTVLMGVSGSGKSTWMDAHPEAGRRVSFDAIRRAGKPMGPVIASQRTKARKLVAAGVPVVGDACNLSSSHRSWWRNLAGEFGVPVLLVVIFPPQLEVLRARQAERGSEAIPDEVLVRQRRQWPGALAAARRERWSSVVEVGAPAPVTASRRW